jgi:hypothetical protein
MSETQYDSDWRSRFVFCGSQYQIKGEQSKEDEAAMMHCSSDALAAGYVSGRNVQVEKRSRIRHL